MPTFEHTIEVEAPVDRVFQFGIDPENWRRTMPSLTDVEIVEETDDALLMNATYRLLGTSMDGKMEMRIAEPNKHTITTFESPGMTGELHYHYAATDSGTKVVQRADYEFGDSLIERVLEPVAKRYNERQFKHSLRTSKELVEAEATSVIEA
ncbi:SRPBCC family protein [Natronosalvus caseinilyticus]|uniref:SRPBCC family protein n=1 Tax=Natronosalvus caseinilyticus TaxID=2953747 RepID=UPI0028A5F914|nr:SRPBCC family protein [Natronosalvus caseinilyticus]